MDTFVSMADKIARFSKEFDLVQSILNNEELFKYFETAIKKGRILIKTDDAGEVIGYVESWRINYEQLGRIVCGLPFHIADEDIETGPICYLTNTAIRPDYRMTGLHKVLRVEFMTQNFMCKHFVGHARRKKHEPLKVFDRQSFYDKYNGGKDGK